MPRPRPGWKRGGRSWTLPGGSWRNCVPNSRPSSCRALALLARGPLRVQFAQAPSLTGLGPFLGEVHRLAGALVRGELVAARSEARDAAVTQAEVRARLEAQAAALADRLAAAEQAQRKAAHDLDAVQAELGAAQRRAERAEAEAALARQLLAELRVAPPGRAEGGGGRRRKAGGPAPTDEAAPGTKPDEQQDEKQGAPAPAPVVCYRNAAGQRWDGQGDMPDWLRRAVNAGQSKEFFRVGG